MIGLFCSKEYTQIKICSQYKWLEQCDAHLWSRLSEGRSLWGEPLFPVLKQYCFYFPIEAVWWRFSSYFTPMMGLNTRQGAGILSLFFNHTLRSIFYTKVLLFRPTPKGNLQRNRTAILTIPASHVKAITKSYTANNQTDRSPKIRINQKNVRFYKNVIRKNV